MVIFLVVKQTVHTKSSAESISGQNDRCITALLKKGWCTGFRWSFLVVCAATLHKRNILINTNLKHTNWFSIPPYPVPFLKELPGNRFPLVMKLSKELCEDWFAWDIAYVRFSNNKLIGFYGITYFPRCKLHLERTDELTGTQTFSKLVYVFVRLVLQN